MTIRTVQSITYASAAAFVLIGTEALAGVPNGGSVTVGTVTHAPSSVSVPMLGGAGLVVLSALLALVAVRFLKDRKRSGGQFMVLALAASVLATGGSGLKLINDAIAIPASVLLSNSSGGAVDIPDQGYSLVLNNTGTTQRITNLSAEPECFFEPPGNGGNGGINGGNGGDYRGTCSDSPPTVLGDQEYCEVFVCCGLTVQGGGCGPL